MRFKFLSAAAICAVVLSGAAHATTIVNGGFEYPIIEVDSVVIEDSTVPGWKNTDGSAADMKFVTSGYNSITAIEGVQFADLNANGATSIYQDVIGISARNLIEYNFAHLGTSAAQGLKLSIYDLGAGQTTLNATSTLLFSQTFSGDDSDWDFYSNVGVGNIVAMGNIVRIVFTSLATGSDTLAGNYLDAVGFGWDKTLPPVPVPAALPLLISGFAVFGVLRRRKRA